MSQSAILNQVPADGYLQLNASKPDYWFEGLKAASDGGEISRDLVCTSKPGVLPPMAGERIVRHVRLSSRYDSDLLMHDLGTSSGLQCQSKM